MRKQGNAGDAWDGARANGTSLLVGTRGVRVHSSLPPYLTTGGTTQGQAGLRVRYAACRAVRRLAPPGDLHEDSTLHIGGGRRPGVDLRGRRDGGRGEKGRRPWWTRLVRQYAARLCHGPQVRLG